jgi:hypothetical protein
MSGEQAAHVVAVRFQRFLSDSLAIAAAVQGARKRDFAQRTQPAAALDLFVVEGLEQETGAGPEQSVLQHFLGAQGRGRGAGGEDRFGELTGRLLAGVEPEAQAVGDVLAEVRGGATR